MRLRRANNRERPQEKTRLLATRGSFVGLCHVLNLHEL